MKLLMESKRAWLLSYILFVAIALICYIFLWNTVIGSTLFVLVITMQILILVFFFLILIFKWKQWCRLTLFCLYIGACFYLWINGYIFKWYIIIPLSILLLFYMMWNIGGVINCVIANKYKVLLDKALHESKGSYDYYKDGVDHYNRRNSLGFWTKIRIKKEPRWKKYEFELAGLELFSLGHALWGISTDRWEKKLLKVSRINSNLDDKHSALENNESLHEEKQMISKISGKMESLGRSTDNFDRQKNVIDAEIDRNKKLEKKILKKRW